MCRVALLLGAAVWSVGAVGELNAEFRRLRDNLDEETRKNLDALDKKWAQIGDLVDGVEKVGENGEKWGGKNVDFGAFKDRWGAKDRKFPGRPDQKAAPSADEVQEAKALHREAKRAYAELASKNKGAQGDAANVREHRERAQREITIMEEWWCTSEHKPSPSQICSTREARLAAAGDASKLPRIENMEAHAKEGAEMHEVYCALPENVKAPPRPCHVWKKRHGAHSDL